MLQDSVYTHSSGWKTYTLTETTICSAPAATCDDSPFTFWRNDKSKLWSTWWTGKQWRNDEVGSEYLLTEPTTLASSPKRVFNVFWVSPGGEVRRTFWQGQGWETELISQAEPRIDAGALPQGLVNSSVGLRIYWRGLDCLLYEARRGDRTWERRRIVHGEMASDPAPLYGVETGRIDVFWKSPEGILMDSVCEQAWSSSSPGMWRKTPYALTNTDDHAPVISEPVALMDTVAQNGNSRVLPRVLPRVLWVGVDDDLYETYYNYTSESWVTQLVDE